MEYIYVSIFGDSYGVTESDMTGEVDEQKAFEVETPPMEPGTLLMTCESKLRQRSLGKCFVSWSDCDKVLEVANTFEKGELFNVKCNSCGFVSCQRISSSDKILFKKIVFKNSTGRYSTLATISLRIYEQEDSQIIKILLPGLYFLV